MVLFPFLNHFRRRYYLRRAIYISLSWTCISVALFLYEYMLLATHGILSTSFDFTSNLTATLIVGVTAGLVGGLLTINWMENWLRIFPFWKALFFIFLAYTATAFIVTLIAISYLKSVELDLPVYDLAVIDEVFGFFGTFLFLRNYVTWLIIVIFTLIVLMINDKYGPGVLKDFLLGRYFHPKKEERVFMFIDIRSATTIAEKIGEESYFNFLKDFFKDIAPAIIFTRGEVYQYVGDEVVVTWKLRNGIYKVNVLRCYFEMKRLINKRQNIYMQRYGAVPDFKVGAHYGKVMTGEIGIVKREIAFSGDTLNTAARIQAMCNELDVDILLSEKLVDIFPYMPFVFKKKDMGLIDLKGKTEAVRLFSFDNKP